MALQFGPRRGRYVEVGDLMREGGAPLAAPELHHYEEFDRIYRALCALLYNYVPTSGHPGGSISSGRFVAGLVFDDAEYDASRPERPDADVISYAAGHKALGLYAMWALRDEVLRVGCSRAAAQGGEPPAAARGPARLPPQPDRGHAAVHASSTAKALDGHPTPGTPFVRLSTGASGVGVSASLGLALGARDYYGADAPRVHIVEGEGGMTPGRVAEALAAAGTAWLDNAILHVDWNQASIDSQPRLPRRRPARRLRAVGPARSSPTCTTGT